MIDAKFMTAHEKELVLKAWTSFFKNGLKFEHFTDRLYKHLSLHCSFIAHYDRSGFYHTYFSEPENTVTFLRQFDKDFDCVSVEYGGTWWLTGDEYNDLNTAMCEAIEPHKAAIYARCGDKERQRDIGHARILLEKHGISWEGALQSIR